MNGPRIYNLFPTLVGPVARWSDHLPRIAAMRFDWIYLNPFTPPGGSGSLYAVSDYRSLNPALRGDGSADADDETLRAFVRDAASHGIRVLVDLVINHTAEDAPLATEHPEWYRHEADGSIAHPFAVDTDDPERTTVWGDLAELDYAPRPERDALVAFVTGIATQYAALGFGGFRCDAAYKVPGDVWKTVIDAVRSEHPDALFVAETLGGPDDEVRQLGPAGFDFFFNSSKWWDFREPWFALQYETYRQFAPSIAFPESHDTPRLAAELAEGADVESEYRFRYLFAAAISSGVMMPVGYEYGFATALDVVRTTPDAWETPRFDLSDFIGAVNGMKAAVPALREEGALTTLSEEGGGIVALLRASAAADSYALLLINPSQTDGAEIAASALAERGITLVDDVSHGLSKTAAVAGDSIPVGPRDLRVLSVAVARREDPALANA